MMDKEVNDVLEKTDAIITGAGYGDTTLIGDDSSAANGLDFDEEAEAQRFKESQARQRANGGIKSATAGQVEFDVSDINSMGLPLGLREPPASSR